MDFEKNKRDWDIKLIYV